MTRYEHMTSTELEERSVQLLHEQNQILKELLRRGWGSHVPDNMEASDILLSERDF